MMSDGKGMDVSVIVAAYNEGAILAENIQRLKAVLEARPGVTWELILVNDGSQDDTPAIMDRAMREDERVRVHHHWRNFGQGRALRNGFSMARGHVILTWDADLSYDPATIWQLIDTLEEKKVEIALASPYAPGGKVRNVPGLRHFLSRWGNRYLASMSDYDVHTITCVVRAYR
ncbi:MAG: glycosyltransferase family 2 protein, partial [Magnetococcales bacterium]|nr:glycosyltransferase family 2 protein [Magnetococcales bacterium]